GPAAWCPPARCNRSDWHGVLKAARGFFFQAEDGIRDFHVTGVQTCALPISGGRQIDLMALVNDPGRPQHFPGHVGDQVLRQIHEDRKSTRLNSSHVKISYAVFCLKKKTITEPMQYLHRHTHRSSVSLATAVN